jgi:Na+-transporting methylmalonyl-CoA/oxaloacetate decarboxylase gamma subunit
MRHFIFLAAILIVAIQTQGQSASSSAPKAETAGTATTPPLTTTVADNPNDSPMVRAAKRAVASRVNPAQRRVVTLTTANTRGRVAFASGPTTGPTPLPAPPSPSAGELRQRESAREVAAIKAAAEKERRDKLKQLENEENMLAAEMDEPYGGDVEEDRVDQRMSEIEAEKQKLQQPPPPPHQ